MARLTAAAVAAASLLASIASAAAGCDDGPWPLHREAAALADTATRAMPSGAQLDADDFSAVSLKLAPMPDAALTRPPERAGDTPGTAGFLRLRIATPGLYQVTLPEAAWLDMIQAGAYLAPEAFGPARDCPGVRKSVRFRLAAGEAVLQLSRTQASAIAVAIARVP